MTALGGLVTGCSTGGGADAATPTPDRASTPAPDQASPDQISLQGADPRIIVAKLSSYTAMRLPGTLGYDSSTKCLYVKHKDQQYGRSTPMWPSGTTPVTYRGKRGVNVPGTGRILDGDAVLANGEYNSNAPALATAGLPAGCPTKGQRLTTIAPDDPTGRKTPTN
ncbi:hypothetical protein SMC26_40785 [Actinomadura fulvescens]|uniref:Lipoprotein n=1 Tax=Actinomadura fulvescens TaxID=46160 RepID=A0ABP6D9D2_9ACTN